jgi:hypothetical protein
MTNKERYLALRGETFTFTTSACHLQFDGRPVTTIRLRYEGIVRDLVVPPLTNGDTITFTETITMS